MHVEPLAGIERIAFPTCVTLADVKHAIRAKGNHATVVIVVRLRDVHDHLDSPVGPFGRDLVGTCGIDRIARDDGCAVER